MNFAAADQVVKAVLYEGYVLYPYRPSSIKNRQRWTFGGIYPAGPDQRASACASHMQSQCIVVGNADTRIEIRLRFLHLMARQVGELTSPLAVWPHNVEPAFRPVPSLAVAGQSHYTWDEAVEREVELVPMTLAEISAGRDALPFAFPASRTVQPLAAEDGLVHGLVARTQAAIKGQVRVTASVLASGVYRLSVRIGNETSVPDAANLRLDAAQLCAFMSTHMMLGVEGGKFASMIDPPEHLAAAVSACVNEGAWPVLIGLEGARDTLLCSPIILYDYPAIAPESPGDLFDGCEIDEILTLRILAMTDAEKREMAATDERARALLARTEALTQGQMQELHGAMRSPRPFAPTADEIFPVWNGMEPTRRSAVSDGSLALRVGDYVRLNPKPGGDIFDLALAGQTAVIESIERDFEDRVHVAVTVDADPGREFGLDRMPGHRFFFSPEEMEQVSPGGNAP